MPTTWEEIAGSLRRQTRRVVSVRGVAWLVLVGMGLLALIGIGDWAWHFDAGWVRLLLAIGFVTAVGVTLWKTLINPLSVRLSDVDIARTIEWRYPDWGDRLSSAAQFRAEQQSSRLGSPELQRALTSAVDRRLDQIDLTQVIDRRPTRQLALAAVVVGLVGLAAAGWHPVAAGTALKRLALPFAEVPWPRTTALQFLDEDLERLDLDALRAAAGEPLALYVENELGVLPDDTTLELMLADGTIEQRRLQTTLLRDEAGHAHEVAIASVTAHVGPLRFRATGGDDTDQTWRTLDIVPSPALSRVEVTVVPPEYAAQPARTLSGPGAIETLVGSEIRIVAEANTPLASATLWREDHAPQPLQFGDGGRRLETTFVLEKPGRSWYWFEITDDHGLQQSHPPRYEVRALADRKPTVFIESPATDVTVTPTADLPLRIVARDDLGLQGLHLVWSRPGAAPVRVPFSLSAASPADETIETTWNLAPLELAPGDRLTYFVEVVDGFIGIGQPTPEEETSSQPGASGTDKPAGQVGRSVPRHVDVLSNAQKHQELADRQLDVLDALEQMKQRQSQALEVTSELRIQAELADRLQSADLDLLKQTELEQQAIREQLADERSGTASALHALQQELERNQIDDGEMTARLAGLAEDLRELGDDLLPTIEQALARARKRSQTPGGDDEGSITETLLSQAVEAQSLSMALLEDATDRLGGWRRAYEVTSQLGSLVTDQLELQQQTQAQGRDTLTKQEAQLTRQEQANLARLSDRQRRLAARLEDLLNEGTADESADGARPAPPGDATQDALRRLAERNTLDQMHEAAESLKRNDIARSTAAQDQVLRDLRDFGELLLETGDTGAERLLSQLEQQAEQVESLKKQQQQLTRDTAETFESRHASPAAGDQATDPTAEQALERLVKSQSELADDVEDLARELRRQQAGRGAQTATRAGRRMREARQAMEQELPDQAEAQQREALDDLLQLSEELAQQRQHLEQELVRQQIEQLADTLQTVADDQQVVIEQTGDLNARQRERGTWSRPLRKELLGLTERQGELTGLVEVAEAQGAPYPVVAQVLGQAVEAMRTATGLMLKDEVGAATIGHQQAAHRRLLMIVEVVRASEASAEELTASGDQPPSPPGSPPPPASDRPSDLLQEQLRLLRFLQSDVQERTATLIDQLRDPQADAARVAAERAALTQEQAAIAELARELLEHLADTPRNDTPKPE